ncbi:MAG: GNAT family N-acetyltransferase [Phenylobacterium sp.]|uniref:GNAT family N-acetyltransferase n=1 Tax=Phenylobacterium sp. TaxID=1871053 RepID=UPI0025FB36C4|nr:GNAT family N-acetyltransferase [Phenylobacterium sp.]MBA4012074.1 GNAT family N-acetyltransferase [Phenylobacterium sp.]
MAQPRFLTDRLILRPRDASDLEASVAVNSDAEVMRYLGDVWPPDRQRAHLSAQIDTNFGEGLGYWSLFEQTAPEQMLGWALLTPLPGTDDVQIGYRLRRDAWGRGIATEAAAQLMIHAFETIGLPALAATVHPENLGSQRVMAKLGFADAGTYDAGGKIERLYRRLA